MGYHPRIECRKRGAFLTTRCRNSELWFVNNPELEQAILGYCAKYATVYQADIYAIAIEGNHIQMCAKFPQGNRAQFMRDFNSTVARAIARYSPEFPGGRPFGRRYSVEFMPHPDDIEDRFFYTVLQPVQDCLVERIRDYPWYNCFHDAVWGVERKFKVVNWTAYNAARRYDMSVSIKQFTETRLFKFKRLPGYEHLSQPEYAKIMNQKLESRRVKLVAERYAAGKSFMGREKLLQAARGSRPVKTKTSTINSHRPRILSVCPKRRAADKAWYFGTYRRYNEASKRYRSGKLDTVFPEGTYRPYLYYRPPENAPPEKAAA